MYYFNYLIRPFAVTLFPIIGDIVLHTGEQLIGKLHNLYDSIRYQNKTFYDTNKTDDIFGGNLTEWICIFLLQL